MPRPRFGGEYVDGVPRRASRRGRENVPRPGRGRFGRDAVRIAIDAPQVPSSQGLALTGYAAWQLGIVLLLDVAWGARIANTAHAMTSVRWLTTADAQGGYSGLVGSAF